MPYSELKLVPGERVKFYDFQDNVIRHGTYLGMESVNGNWYCVLKCGCVKFTIMPAHVQKVLKSENDLGPNRTFKLKKQTGTWL